MQRSSFSHTKYSHEQWKNEYNNILTAINDSKIHCDNARRALADKQLNSEKKLLHTALMHTVNASLELVVKKKDFELIGRHYEFFHSPHLLLAKLIHDVSQLLDAYDLLHPAKQSDVLRYFMLTIRRLMEKMTLATQFMVDNEENCQEFQDRYEELCAELSKSASELHHHEPDFLHCLLPILKKYDIPSPHIHPLHDFSLLPIEAEKLHKEEKKAYHAAVQKLSDALKITTKAMEPIKKSGEALIKAIEANRTATEADSCMPKKHFDYKRHTLNLTKTHELLKSPRSKTVHEEYTRLIKANPNPPHVVSRIRVGEAMATFFGTLMIALGIGVSLFAPYVGIPCLLTGSVITSWRGTLFAKTFKANTAKNMQSVQRDIVQVMKHAPM